MAGVERVAGAAGRASIMAGPLYLLLLMLVWWQENAAEAVAFAPLQLLPALLLIPLSCIVGVVLAFPVCLIMGSILAAIADPVPLARPLALWLMVAAGTATLIVSALTTTITDGWSLAFMGTAMGCATIMHRRLDWG